MPKPELENFKKSTLDLFARQMTGSTAKDPDWLVSMRRAFPSDRPANDPAQAAQSLQMRMDDAGVEYPSRKPWYRPVTTVLGKALDLLNHPGYAVRGAFTESVIRKKGYFGTITGFLRGLTGLEEYSTANIMQESGVERLKDNPNAQFALGLAGDILTDPLTFITGGAKTALEGIKAADKLGDAAKVADVTEQIVKGGGLAEDMLKAKDMLKQAGVVKGVDKIADAVPIVANPTTSARVTNALEKLKEVAQGIDNKTLKANDMRPLVDALDDARITVQKALREGPLAKLNAKYTGTKGYYFENLSDVIREYEYRPFKLMDHGVEVALDSPEAIRTLMEKGVRDNFFADFIRARNDVRIEKSTLILDVYKGELASRLNIAPNLVSAMTFEQLTNLDAMTGLLGPVTKIDGLTDDLVKSAARLEKTSKKANLVPESLDKMSKARSSMYQLIREGTAVTVEMASGISYEMTKAEGAWVYRFMNKGRPLFELTPIKDAMRKGYQALYQKSPVYKKLVDLTGRAFLTKYVSPAFTAVPEKITEEILPGVSYSRTVGKGAVEGIQLRRVADDVEALRRAESAIPTAVRTAVSNTYGVRRMKDAAFLERASYFFEYGRSPNATMLVDYLTDGTLRADPEMARDVASVFLDQLAVTNPTVVEAWRAMPKFTSDELVELQALNLKRQMHMQVAYDIDKSIRGKEMPEAIESYIKHLYVQDDKGAVIDHTAEILSKRRSVKGKAIASATKMTSSAMEHREILSIADAEIAGLKPIKNAALADSFRLHETSRMMLHRDFLTHAQRVPDVIKNVEGTDPRVIQSFRSKGWKERDIGVRKVLVHPEADLILQRLDKTFFNEYTMAETMRTFDKVTNFIKTLQTSLNPSFHARNIPSEFTMSLLAQEGKLDIETYHAAGTVLSTLSDFAFDKGKGLNMSEVYEVMGPEWSAAADKVFGQISDPKIEFVKEAYENGKQATQVIKLGGKSYSLAELVYNFRNQGLGWSGQTMGNLVEDYGQSLVKAFNEKGLLASYAKSMTTLGDTSETFFRMADFLWGLKKGFSVEEAANIVRKFHVDYRDITAIEKNVIKRWFPYYTYMRKNLPMQLRLLLERPGYPIVVSALISNAYNRVGNPATSEYLTQNLAIPLLKGEDGNIMYLNLNLPLADLNRLRLDDMGILRETVGMLSPLIKAPFEALANQNFNTGAPIVKYEGEEKTLFPGAGEGALNPRVPAALSYALSQLGVANVVRRAVGAALPEEATTTVQPQLAQPGLNPLHTMFSSLLPVQNPNAAVAAKEYEYRDKLAAVLRKSQKEDQRFIPGVDDLKNAPEWLFKMSEAFKTLGERGK